MPFADLHNEHLRLKDHRQELRLVAWRLAVAAILVFGLFCILAYRFYSLQIVNYQAYATRAESNRIQVQPVPPTRGLIYDRNGVLLAENRPSYTLSIVRERVGDLATTLDDLAALIELTEEDRNNFYRGLQQRRRPHEPVPLRYRLSEDEMARIAVNEYRLDGVEVEAQLVRHYPYGDLLAHAVGYVGRINEREVAGFDPDTYRLYSGTHSIGKTGIERFYERELLGRVGSQHVEVNAHGRILRTLQRVDPVPGEDLHLHLDIQLQRTIVESLGTHRAAVVALDLATGGVLALVSTPSFDPNLFVTGIGYHEYRRLSQSIDLPLFNRTILGQYPPGSILKPMFGIGGLETGATTTQHRIRDPGFFRLENDDRLYRDWKRGGHGNQVDLHQAIVESCDTYFYDLAVRMGIDRMHPVGASFGLGQRTGIDIPSERPGLWPSRAWKRAARGLPWFPGDSLNVSIGQGDVLTTPVQMATMTAGLAGRGSLRDPKLVAQIGDTPLINDLRQVYSAPEVYWDYVIAAMEAVVHGRSGTARLSGRGASYRMAGKTGTAQVIGIAQNAEYDRDAIHERNRDHALYVAFAPVQAPQIAVAVIVENGEAGSSAAAPIARVAFDTWFALEAARRASSTEHLAGDIVP